MKRIELRISALSQSVTYNQSFAVILTEVEGNRSIPVVIGMFEAQAIAIKLEKIPPTRPLTHDLFKNVLDDLDVSLSEIVINDLKEGVFYAQLVCEFQEKQFIIDSRTSDAVALAVRFQCPIYTFEAIMEEASVIINPEGEMTAVTETKQTKTSSSSPKTNSFEGKSYSELEELLKTALVEEDYEKAASIRDEMQKRS